MYSKVIISLVFLCFASQCFAFPSPSEGSGSGDVDVLVVNTTTSELTNTTNTTTTTTTTVTKMTAEKCAAEGRSWVAKCPVSDSCKGSGKKECCPTQKVYQCVDDGALSNAVIGVLSCLSILIVICIICKCIKSSDSYNPYS